MRKISVLLVTSRVEDLKELKEILHETPWDVADTLHLEEAGAALKAAPVPILLFDRDVAGGCWQETMKRLLKSRRNACVILVSNVSDQYLWEEVIQHGGFDFLSRPFRKEQVLSTLVFAYAQCRTPWPKTVGESH